MAIHPDTASSRGIRSRSLAGAAALAVFTVVVGCRSADREKVRAEAGRMSNAIERLRNAPNEGKGEPLGALEELSCSADDLCELRRTCVEAYRAHVDALDQVAKARRSLEHADAPMTAEAAALIGTAQRGLERAKEGAERCADLQGAAARRYHL